MHSNSDFCDEAILEIDEELHLRLTSPPLLFSGEQPVLKGDGSPSKEPKGESTSMFEKRLRSAILVTIGILLYYYYYYACNCSLANGKRRKDEINCTACVLFFVTR